MKIVLLVVSFLLFLVSGSHAQEQAVATPPADQGDTKALTASAGLNFVQYMNQQTNLDTGGPKINPTLGFEKLVGGVPTYFAIISGSAPSITSQQTAALRLLLPADLDFKIEPQFSLDTNWYFTLSADLSMTTLPQKAVVSNSSTVYSPGFFGITGGTWGEFPIGGATDVFDHFGMGMRLRWVSSPFWNQDSVNQIFPLTSSFTDNSFWDYSLWAELGFKGKQSLKVQYYSYVSGNIGTYAYNPGGNYFNSGVLSVQIVQEFDLGGGNDAAKQYHSPSNFLYMQSQ